MKIEEVLPAYREGGRIKRSLWGRGVRFNECDRLTYRDVIADDWEIVEEPKPPKLMAPAFFKCGTGVYVSGILFSSTEDAIDRVIGDLIAWPAIPDANGFYSVPQE